MKDVFTTVYDFVLTKIRSTPAFDRLVQRGNVISFTQLTGSPFKTGTASSDYPEIILQHTTLSGNLTSNSSTNTFDMTYGVFIASGTYDHRVLNEVLEVFIAGLILCLRERGECTWRGEQVLKGIRIENAPIGFTQDQMKNERGFTTVLSFHCDIIIRTDTFLNTLL